MAARVAFYAPEAAPDLIGPHLARALGLDTLHGIPA
jgi:hypothetical protein